MYIYIYIWWHQKHVNTYIHRFLSMLCSSTTCTHIHDRTSAYYIHRHKRHMHADIHILNIYIYYTWLILCILCIHIVRINLSHTCPNSYQTPTLIWSTFSAASPLLEGDSQWRWWGIASLLQQQDHRGNHLGSSANRLSGFGKEVVFLLSPTCVCQAERSVNFSLEGG